MKDILKKAGKLGSAVADTVKGAAEDVRESLAKEKGFLVEKFPNNTDLQDRLNTLQENFGSVDVQAVCQDNDGYLVVIVKVEE